jgi:molecular chaperone HscB
MAEETQAQCLCSTCGVQVPRQIHFCTSCAHVLPLPNRISYFEFLEMPDNLDVDLDALEKTFYRLSRQLHPDFFQNRPEEEQRAVLERSATLNKAYDTLRDTTRRVEYLMKLRGFEPATAKNQVPQDLALEIMELQEQIEEYQSSEGLARERCAQSLEAGIVDMKERREALVRALPGLCRQYDHTPDERKNGVLEEMRKSIDKSNYLARIIENVEKALGQPA